VIITESGERQQFSILFQYGSSKSVIDLSESFCQDRMTDKSITDLLEPYWNKMLHHFSKKTRHKIFGHNIGKYRLNFKILSLTYSQGNYYCYYIRLMAFFTGQPG